MPLGSFFSSLSRLCMQRCKEKARSRVPLFSLLELREEERAEPAIGKSCFHAKMFGDRVNVQTAINPFQRYSSS